MLFVDLFDNFFLRGLDRVEEIVDCSSSSCSDRKIKKIEKQQELLLKQLELERLALEVERLRKEVRK